MTNEHTETLHLPENPLPEIMPETPAPAAPTESPDDAARAAALGWAPQEQWAHDPTKWKNAKEFLASREGLYDRRMHEQLMQSQALIAQLMQRQDRSEQTVLSKLSEMDEAHAADRTSRTVEAKRQEVAMLDSMLNAAVEAGETGNAAEILRKRDAAQREVVAAELKAAAPEKKPAPQAEPQPQTGYARPPTEAVQIETFKAQHSAVLANQDTYQRASEIQHAAETKAYTDARNGWLPPGETPLSYSLKETERFLKARYYPPQPPAQPPARPQAPLNGSVPSAPQGENNFGKPEGLKTEHRATYDSFLNRTNGANLAKYYLDAAKKNPSAWKK